MTYNSYDPSNIIYALIDPRNHATRYVGTTTSSADPELAAQIRLKEHLRCSDTNTEKIAWIRELKTAGMQPQIRIIEEIHWRQASEREIYWIKYYLDAGAPLVNIRIARRYKAKFRGQK